VADLSGDGRAGATAPTTTAKVADGTVLVFDALQWDEPGWEFGSPSVVLAPVLRVWENGESLEQIMEDLCDEACVDGELHSEPVEEGLVNRRWKLTTLRQRFREAIAGREFPVKNYQAQRVTMRFYRDEHGELAFDEVSGAALTRPGGAHE
jgi:hypothetical protein